MINIYMDRKICKNVINTYYVILSTTNIYIYNSHNKCIYY